MKLTVTNRQSSRLPEYYIDGVGDIFIKTKSGKYILIALDVYDSANYLGEEFEDDEIPDIKAFYGQFTVNAEVQ